MERAGSKGYALQVIREKRRAISNGKEQHRPWCKGGESTKHLQ